MADPRPSADRGETLRAEAERRGVSTWQVRKDRGGTTDVRSALCIRLPEELADLLREAADDRDLSVNYLVIKAVEEFLPRLIPADELRLTRARNSEPQTPNLPFLESENRRDS